MPIRTIKTLLEHINDSWKGKIVFWMEKDLGSLVKELQYGVILHIDTNGTVIVTQKGLPRQFRKKGLSEHAIRGLSLDVVMMGVTEITVMDN